MSIPRQPIPKDVETRVLLACRRRCCLCWLLNRDDTEKPGQLAHVDRNHANAAEDNLAWLCLPHHEQYDRTSRQAKGLTPEELRHARAELIEHLRTAEPSVQGSGASTERCTPEAPIAFNQPGAQIGQATFINGPAQITIGSQHINMPAAAKKPKPTSHPAARKPAAPQPKPATPPTSLPPTQPPPQSFDVFLSHNSQDKPAVRDLKRRLVARKLSVWFDADQLQPGIPWQRLLEDGIKASASVAVIIGRDGLGPWEDEEMQAALRLAVKDKRPVIPVLLPGAPKEPELPAFLSNRTWVDLRAGFSKAGLDRLQWGITGQKPQTAAASAAGIAPTAGQAAATPESDSPCAAVGLVRESGLQGRPEGWHAEALGRHPAAGRHGCPASCTGPADGSHRKPQVGPSVPHGDKPVGLASTSPDLADISRIDKYARNDLIGREAETKLLRDAWGKVRKGTKSHPHVLIIVGLGGEGKTSLVAKWAVKEMMLKGWPGCDAAFAWSFYSQGTREQQAASSDLFLKEALTFFAQGDPKEAEIKAFAASPAGAFEKGQRLARLVGQRRSLLILDGLEPLQYAPTAPTPGELKDQGLAALLKGLAAASHGLCVVTTRYSLPDLKAFWPAPPSPSGRGAGGEGAAREVKLLRLSRDAGVHLLKTLGVKGSELRNLPIKDDDEKSEKVNEFEKLVEDVKGHALTLNLLGTYLRDAHAGDIRKRGLVKLEEADAESDHPHHAFHVLDAYVKWLAGFPLTPALSPGEREKGSPPFDKSQRAALRKKLATIPPLPAGEGRGEGERAQQMLALLRLMGLFDRPATADCLTALWSGEAIPGLTEPLVGLNGAQRNIALKRLEDAKLLTVNRDASGALVSLDAHPHLREYFARQLRAQQPDAWRAAHRRLYEHLCASTPDKPQPTLEDLQPLYQAVAHGCQAGLQQETAEEVYFARILKRNEQYSWKKLGSFGSELGAVACFFENPWSRISPVLTSVYQAWLVSQTPFYLRALGRLTEALEPMRAGLKMGVEAEDWEEAAIRASNLSGLELTLGEVAGAVGDAEQSVTYADRSGDAFQRMGKRTTHADALHQAGRRAEAEARFREAEQMQQERQPDYPQLYSLQGFRYCDLLLAAPERAAWRVCVAANWRSPQTSSADPEALARKDGGERQFAATPLLESCRAVSQRAAQTLKIVEAQNWLLDIALDHLTLGRASLYEAILESCRSRREEAQAASPESQRLLTSSPTIETARCELDTAVSGLRRAGTTHHIPRALLTRAWLRFLTGARTGPESAQEDLDEAWEIAERGPMRLSLADIHLYRARLCFREKPYPWASPQAELSAGRKLIEQCGYWRRKEELEVTEKVMGVAAPAAAPTLGVALTVAPPGAGSGA